MPARSTPKPRTRPVRRLRKPSALDSLPHFPQVRPVLWPDDEPHSPWRPHWRRHSTRIDRIRPPRRAGDKSEARHPRDHLPGHVPSSRSPGNLSGMEGNYPAQLLARETAPTYNGEGPFALWHFSEDPSLGVFHPRLPASGSGAPLVWAVDTRHAPMFWFPRDCPRGCIWEGSATSTEDRERFFGQSAAKRVHAIEANWLESVQSCHLIAYRLPTEPFRPHEVGGYWVASEVVEAIERVEVGDLLARHATAGIELRITPSIWPFWRQVTGSTVEFSGSRLRNAAPHPDQLP
jgi:hypothetical protein